MDNQQALAETEKAWLAGFFDGEGSVGMNICGNHSAMWKKHTRRLTIMIPRLTLGNTDYQSIMYYAELFKKANVGVNIRKKRRGNPKHKTIYITTIAGHKRCKKAIPILMEYSVTKKAQLNVMRRWIKHREETYHYSIRDYEYYLEWSRLVDAKGPNDSTLRRLYDSCTSEFSPYRGGKGSWESRRKVESGLCGNA